MDEIVWRRFGRDHDKPCRNPTVLTCAFWECQVANECQDGVNKKNVRAFVNDNVRVQVMVPRWMYRLLEDRSVLPVEMSIVRILEQVLGQEVVPLPEADHDG